MLWKTIPGFKRYQVSDHGQVRRRSDGKAMRLGTQPNGYAAIGLARDGAKHRRSVHRLVMLAFSRRNIAGRVVHHVNGDKADNRLSNLDVVTHQEHCAHHNQRHPLTKECLECGRTFTPHPTKRKRAKTCSRECRFARIHAANCRLTDGQVRAIRRRRAAGELLAPIAEAFGVSESTVSAIHHRRTRAECD